MLAERMALWKECKTVREESWAFEGQAFHQSHRDQAILRQTRSRLSRGAWRELDTFFRIGDDVKILAL